MRRLIPAVLVVMAAALVWPMSAGAATSKHVSTPSLTANHTELTRSQPAVLHGHARVRTVLYAHAAGKKWHRVRTVRGTYRVTVRPLHTTWYRVGSSRHVKVKVVTPKPVTACGSWNKRMAGTWAVYNAGQYMASSLFQATDRLICSAADGATINVRMYFASGGGAAANKLIGDLALMHKYHGVRVNLLVQRDDSGTWVHRAATAMPWARLYTCYLACQTGAPGSIAHSKWISVSKMKYGSGTGVLTLSANLTTQQYTNWEDGVLSIGNPGLYAAVLNRWNSDVSCSLQAAKHCVAHNVTGTWQNTSDPHTQIYFAPIANDPIAEELAALDCSQGGTIYYASLDMPRQAILNEFLNLQAAGCTLRVVIEHPTGPHPGLTWLTHLEHDKLLVIDTPTRRVAFSGSECFTPGGLSRSDNVMLRLTQSAVVNTFVGYMKTMWATSHSVPPVSPTVAARYAAAAARTDS